LKLDLPPAATLQPVELPPGQVLRVAYIHPTHIDEERGVEAEFAQYAIAARPGDETCPVEGQQERARREADLLASREPDELAERDGLVARVAQQGHLPGELLRLDPAVVEEHGDHRAIWRFWRPQLPIAGTEHHPGGGLRTSRGGPR
jgi:hypothetical protein